MSRIVLSTSSTGLDNLNIRNDIQTIQLRIYINNVEFVDGKNINTKSLQYMMQEVSKSPIYIASAPAIEVAEILTKLQSANVKEVFVTTLSSAMCNSYNLIKKVSQSFQDSMAITVYDCKDLGSCESLFALEAESLMNQGHSMPRIVDRLDELRASYQMLFAVEDLASFNRNSRNYQPYVSGDFFNNLLGIKPILQATQEGQVIPVSKARNLNSALEYIIHELGDIVQRVDSFAYVLSSGQKSLDDQFVNLLKKKTGINSIAVVPASTIGLTTYGPTGVGLGVFYGQIPYAARLCTLY